MAVSQYGSYVNQPGVAGRGGRIKTGLRGGTDGALEGFPDRISCSAALFSIAQVRLNDVPPRVGILVCEVLKDFLHIFQSPVLTRERVRIAYAVALTTDVIQLLLGPFGWAFADELLDVTAMILTWRLIGFHPLLLPTFALEFLPVADMLPAWTGCVALVVALRKRQQAKIPLPPGPVIDV